jgi:hypothetical protein
MLLLPAAVLAKPWITFALHSGHVQLRLSHEPMQSCKQRQQHQQYGIAARPR